MKLSRMHGSNGTRATPSQEHLRVMTNKHMFSLKNKSSISTFKHAIFPGCESPLPGVWKDRAIPGSSRQTPQGPPVTLVFSSSREWANARMSIEECQSEERAAWRGIHERGPRLWARYRTVHILLLECCKRTSTQERVGAMAASPEAQG